MAKLLDLCCKAGGAAVGYYRAGFDEIVGVDIEPQPRYPFEFVQDDAFGFLVKHGREFDVIHASPPCKAFSAARRRNHHASKHPDLLTPMLDLLHSVGRPYVVENVYGSPLPRPSIMLCGLMFGLKVLRHRFFFLRGSCSRRHTQGMATSRSESTVSAPFTGTGTTRPATGVARNESTSTRTHGQRQCKSTG